MSEGYKKSRGSIYLTIRSRDLINTSNLGNGNSGRFILFEAIEASNDEVLGVKIASATFPNSWYNLSATTKNNLFTFIEGGTTYNTIIPDGNYDIIELMAKIKSIMESVNGGAIQYTFSYDEINNQVKIISNSSTITTLKFSLNNSPRRMLGFTNEDINLNSFTALYSNIIAHIPVLFSRNSFFTYEPSNPFEMELTQKQINSIDINITYQDENIPVNFNRADWEINLEIDFHLKPKETKKYIKIHNDIMNKYDAYKQKEADQLKLIDELKNIKNRVKINNGI